jgi:branched-chain amino acid transport system ATP-binding protein
MSVFEARSAPRIALELCGVRAAYGRIEVLKGVDLVVPAGSVFALLGRNGAGKSTTLKVISGQLPPTHGQVRLSGHVVNGAGVGQLARAGLCLVPEGRGVFPGLSVRDNLTLMSYAGAARGDIEERAYTQFPRLRERRRQLAGTMSGGEQQMLALARALTTNPAVLLLDELSMGLAPIVVEELYAHVADIARQGVSILVVEQFARTVLSVANFAAHMEHGRVLKVGRPDELAAELSDAYFGDHGDVARA